MVFGFLSRIAKPFIGALTGGGGILSTIAKPIISGVGNLFGKIFQPSTPLGQVARAVGPTVSQWAGSEPFMGTMRKYGNDLGTRLGFTKLLPYTMGNNLGDVYYKGMRYVMDYVKDGQRPDMPAEMQQQMLPPQGGQQQPYIEKIPSEQPVMAGRGGAENYYRPPLLERQPNPMY